MGSEASEPATTDDVESNHTFHNRLPSLTRKAMLKKAKKLLNNDKEIVED